jgi:gliding motility-associated-like protein
MPVVQDNCSVTVTASHIPGATFPVGVTTVTYTATDQSGNQATCSFTVTIRDNINPVLSNCPSDIELTAGATCTAITSWTPPNAQDNCSVNVTTSHQPGTEFPIGETIVTYTATDPSGNTATCSFTITVNNTQLPVLENCPDNLVVDADESNTAIVTWDEPEFSIACGALTITQSHEPGDVFPEGATQVIYTAENEAGDVVECRFTVTVNRKVLNLKATPAITPNGDGIQDVWIIQDIEFFPNNRVVVVDRWGGIVYEASGYNNVSVVWTGENTSGNLLPTGTYFYRIEIQQMREVLTGSIELVR